MNRNRHTSSKGLAQALREKAPNERTVFQTKGGKTTQIKQPVKIRTYSVCWGIPTDEVIFTEWFKNYINLPIMLWDTVSITQATYLVAARNAIHRNFLKNTTDDWLVMLDSDVLPPPDFLERLMESGKKIIGGWYHMKSGTFGPAVYDRYEERGDFWYWNPIATPRTGVEKVMGIGAGCLLMNRSVAEQLGEEPYGTYSGGEDMVMCRLLKEKNIDLFVDWSVACAHAGVAVV